MEEILRNDFQYIYDNLESKVDTETCLKEAGILITGSTGFIGSLLTRFFLYLNDTHGFHIRLILLVRNMRKAKEMYPDSKVELIEGDICTLRDNDCLNTESDKCGSRLTADFIFHCAAVTKSKEMIDCPVETADGIVSGTKNLLELARKLKVKSMVYLSSMEVYGAVREALPATEEMLGDIDLFHIRSCYPMGKRMAENLCFCYSREYQVPVKIARLAQTFGAGILPGENRIFAQFAECAHNETDIVLHTKGDSRGNYCYCADAILGLLLLLFQGNDGEAYNIANEEASMTILEMAEFVSKSVAGGTIKVVFDIPEDNSYGYAAKTELHLSSEKIRKLGWKPHFGMLDMYQRMMGNSDNYK